VATPASSKAGAFALHVPILMYHRIVPTAQAGNSLQGLVVSPELFAAQLDALEAAGWRTITMATLTDDLQAHVKPPARTFVITIDDGWEDGYTYALPILQQHGFVATYFIITGRIDHPGFVTSAQLRALVAAGDEIGDHTMDHVDLFNQSAAKETYEIDAAAARIAQVTGRWPQSLAYPSGGVSARAVAAVAACQELRMAVIEEPVTRNQPAASPSPGSTGLPASTPRAVAPMVLETWANRFVVPRIRVSPTTSASRLLSAVDIYRAG
jgi:peptidoglycan/xylan/chitin deacetylase (PgdA/CDA1 family)